MNRSELEKVISNKHNLSRKIVHEVFSTLIEEITQELERGNKVVLPKLGIFEPKTTAPRNARNIQTGELIRIDSTMRVAFHPSKPLKRRVRQNSSSTLKRSSNR